MKKIPAPHTSALGRAKKFETWLIPKTLRTPDGREWPVDELMSQCRREYHSISLQKKTNPERKFYQRYPPEQIRWIAEQDIDVLQYQLQLTRPQAKLLKYRSQMKIRNGQV